MGEPGPQASQLVAEPCPVSAERWHREALARAEGARRRYHEAWLHHLERPDDPTAALPVSVVIPVRNGNAWIRDAVASALAQTHPRVEVVVVDDGSDDPPDRVLGDVEGPLRIVRQRPSGVAAARNRGVREAHGELIRFLDADDLMDADCVARQLAAFRRVPDAELCTCSYRTIGGHKEKSARTHRPPPIGDDLCPTRSLLDTVMERYPFHTSTVLVPRWVLMDAGPMDEALPHGEDSRYWFRLALRGTKVVAVDAELGTRRFVPQGLTSDGTAQRLSWARVGLLNLIDVLDDPALWIYLGNALRRLGRPWDVVDHGADPLVASLRKDLLVRVAALPELGAAHGLSARPPLALLRRLADAHAATSPPEGLARGLAAASREAWARSAEPGAADVALWLRHACLRRRCSSKAAFAVLQDWAEERLGRGEVPLPAETLERLALRRGPGLARRWREAAALAPWLGSGAAMAVARTRDRATARLQEGVRRARIALRLRTRLRRLGAGAGTRAARSSS